MYDTSLPPLSPSFPFSIFLGKGRGVGWWALVIGAGGKEKVGKPNFRQGMLFIYDSTYVTRVRPGGEEGNFYYFFYYYNLYVERYRLMAASVLAAPAMVGKT